MKYHLSRICILFFICGGTPLLGQDIAIKANLSINSITDFNEDFLGGGVGLEGAVGRKWTVGADLSWASSDDHKLFYFNPAARFYFNRAMQGFFIGVGASVHRLKTESGLPVGFPIPLDRGSEAVIGGPEFQLGLQTEVRENFTLGVKAGIAAMADAELNEVAAFNLNFTAGYRF